MQKFLRMSEVKEIITNYFESKGEYVESVKLNKDGDGFIVNTLPNPMCNHTYVDGDEIKYALTEVNGKTVCSICGAKFTKNKI